MKAKFAILFYFAICFGFVSESYGQCSVSLSGNTSVCQGGSTTITANATGFAGTPAFTWSPSGSGASSTVSPASTTTYSVTANDGTCSSVATITITVNANPTAGFTFNNNNSCSGTSVSFTSSASGGQSPYSYAWNFGGAGNSAQPNPSFTFSPGSGGGSQAYSVTLTVTDNRGCTASSTQTVNVSRKPDASIEDQDIFTPWTFCDSSGGLQLLLNNTSSTQATNTNYTINWGDGTTPYNSATLPNGTSHTYSAQGYFNLVLTLTGSNGCTATSTENIFVGGNPEIGLANPGGTVNVCASKQITFPITNFSNNPPGTTYTLTVNDGSAPVVFQHPPPSSYTHNFNISSCDFTSLGGFANAFHVRIVAENPCGTTAALVEPIRLGSPPVADYTFTPPPDICVGNTVDFTSTAEGQFNNNGVCNNLLAGGWSITPASGWTLVSGSLTSPNPMSINFSQDGIYNVRLIVSNPCGADTTIKPVCVAPIPDADFSVSSLTGCAPLTVPITNISNTIGTCGNTAYAWAVVHNGSLCSSGGNWSFQAGNASSPSPTITFNGSGTYALALTITNNCGTSIETKIITVDKIPEMTIAPIADICAGNTIVPPAVINSCYSSLSNVSWSFPGGNPSTSTSQIPGAVTYSSSGTFTVTLSATNACGTGTDNESFTISPPPPVPVISSNSPICAGQTITINVNSINGVTYTWTGPGGFTSSQQNVSIPNSTAANAGTYMLVVTDGLGCTNTASITVIVNPLPIVTINSPPPICTGGSVQLDAVGGGTYSWSPVTGLSGTTGSTVTANPTATTTYTVTVTSANGCTSTGSATVTVNPLPVITLSGGGSICVGQSTTLSAGGGASYSWSPPTGLSSTTGQNVTANPTVTTTYTVTGTSAQGCTSTATTTVTVNPLPTITASANQNTLCNGQSATLTATGANTYVWSPATGLSSTNGSPVTASPTSTTTYTVTGTNAGGCSNTGTVTITVFPLPTIDVTPVAPSICIGTSTSLTASGGSSYTWSPATGLSGTSGATVTATPTSTTTYSVMTTDANGCIGTRSVTVTVNPFVNVIITPTNPAICTGSSTTLTATGGTTYTWSPATGLSSTSGTTVIANPISTTTYSVTATNGNGCSGTGDITVTVNPLPDVNVVANGNNICQGQSVTLNATGADTYTWTPVTGLSSTMGATVTATLNSTTTYTTTGTDAQGCQNSGQVTVTILLPPVITITPANPGICVGGSTTLTASAIGGVNFTWSPAAGLNTVTGSTVTANPGGTTTYTVSVTDGNGCRNSENITVTVNPLPNVSVTPNNPAICLGGAATLTASAAGGTNFTWSPSSGLNTTTGGTVTANPVSTTDYTVSVTDGNGCSATGTATVAVNPIPNVSAIANPSSVCLGQSATLTATGAVDYLWTPATGLSSTIGSTVTANPTTTTTYIVTGTSGQNCTDTGQVTLTILPLPIITIIPNNPAICIGNSVTLTATGGVDYTWLPDTGLNTTTGDNVTANPTSTSTYTVSVTDSSGCSDSKNVNVTVNPLPVVDARAPQTFCDQPVPVQLIGNPNGGTWSGQHVTSGGTFTPADTGTFNITYTFTELATSCSNSDNTLITVVGATPADAGTDQAVCVGSISFTLNGNLPGGTWSGNPHINSSGDFNPSVPGTFDAVYSIGTGTCLDRDTAIIIVHDLPVMHAGNGAPVCIDATPFILFGYSPQGGTWSGPGITDATLGIFSPSVVGDGTHTITYSYTDNLTCSNSDSRTVIVNPLPFVEAGSPQTFCNQPIPVQLNGNPVGGTWSGSGITSGGIFTPSSAGTGTWMMTYTYSDNHQCTNSDSVLVSVIDADTANAGPDFAVCRNGSSIDLNANNNPNPPGGTWSGTGVTNNFFYPATGNIGSNNIIYSIGTGTCLSIDTCVIVVNPLPVISVNPITICEGSSNTLSASGAITYNWSPTTGLSDSVGQTVIASPITTTTYSVLGTDANGCVNNSNTTVAVNPLPIVSADAPQTFCNQPIPAQLNGNPVGGAWSGNGISPGGIFTPSSAGTGTWMMTYTYSDNHQCTNSDSVLVSVIDADTANAGPHFAVCRDGSPINLNVSNNPDPPGGIWSGTGVANNFFNPATAANGQNIIIYSIGTGTCLTIDSAIATVNPLPSITVNSPTICEGNSDTLRATGSVSYQWSPATGLSDSTGATVIALPVITTLYTVTGIDSNTCVNTSSSTVTVHPLPFVDAGPDTQFCNQIIPAQFIGNPANGIWSGTGVTSTGLFTPSQAGLGTSQLIYSLSDSNSCTNSDTMQATVIAPVVADAGLGDTACINDSPVLPVNPYPATGGTWSGTGIIDATTGIFDPSVAGAGTHQLTYTLGGGTCLTSDSRDVFVSALPVIKVNPNIPETCFRQDITLTASGAVTYSWSPSTGLNTTTGTTVIANIDSTATYDVTGTNIFGCSDIKPVTVLVHQLPIVTTSPDTSMCNQNNFSIQFTGAPNGGTWAGAFVTTDGLFTPGGNPSDVGMYNLTYAYTDQFGCTDSSITSVDVIAPAFAVAGPRDTFCLNDLPVVLQGFSPTGGIFSGLGVTDNQTGLFNPTVAGTGIKNISYSFGSGTCLTHDTTSILIRELPRPDFTHTPTCIGETTQFTDLSVPFANIISNWQWDFGDSATSNTQNPLHTFAAPGDYNVTLAVMNSNGCSKDTTMIVTIHPLPTVTFTHPPLACPDSLITFTLSNVDATQYDWDFGDGATATGVNPTHIYTVIDTFPISLHAVTQYGCKDSSESEIQVGEHPEADFVLSPASGCGPLEVSIRYLPQNLGVLSDFTWDFGNGQSDYTMIPPRVTYAGPVNQQDTFYIVTLWVQSRACQQVVMHKDTVRVTAEPKVVIKPVSSTGCSPLTLTIETEATGAADSIVVDFGDGTGTVLQSSTNVTHTFTNTLGRETFYWVKYTAYYSCGISRDSLRVNVHPSIVNASITVNSDNNCVDQKFTLTSHASGAQYIFYDLGTNILNPNSDLSPNIQLSYNSPGEYTIYQYVYSADSCGFDLDSVKVNVVESPNGDFDIAEIPYECGGPVVVDFINNSSGATTYYWDYGDGTNSNSTNGVNGFTGSGTFNITLIAENNIGCKDTVVQPLVVDYHEHGLYVPNAFSPEFGDPKVRLFKPAGVCLDTYHLCIFNQWGELLWETDKLNDRGEPAEGWDGRHMNTGLLLQQDVYAWKIEATFTNNEVWGGKEYNDGRIRKIGSVTLLR